MVLSIACNILAVTACLVSAFYSIKFYRVVKSRQLLILPVSLLLAASPRALRVFMLAGLVSVDEMWIRDALSAFYVLLAISIVLMFRTVLNYMSGTLNRR